MLKILGLVPVPIDIKLSNLQINTDQIEKKITKRQKAILVIHNYGSICDLKKIKRIAKKKSLLSSMKMFLKFYFLNKIIIL